MLRNLFKLMTLSLMAGMLAITPAKAQELQKQYEYDDDDGGEYYDRVRVDRYLNVEVWSDHDDNEYYEGDRVKFYFRVNRDAFVAIYTIDTRGRVHLLYPSRAGRDNYVTGGVTHSFPGRSEDYDLVVSGPAGVENVQIIASREPMNIPNWYDNSGLFCDWEDRHDYMDWVNGQYFARYEGQRFAFDRTALYVYEWEANYFRPVYRPYYPNWTVSGNVYVDYWPGSSIYIDGIFWGISPCYIPRIYVGWHTFTIYDRYNHCWEYDVHVTRYNTVVLDHTVIVTQPGVRSKFKTVRFAGYQEPTKAGYTNFSQKLKQIQSSGAWKTEKSSKIVIDNKEVVREKAVFTGAKKFVQGSAKVVKTERGIETAGSPIKPSNQGSVSKRPGTDIGVGKKSVGKSDNSNNGSIYQRRDTYNPDAGKRGSSSGMQKSNLRKSDNPARKSNNSEGTSGTYKKSSNTASKNAPAKARAVPKQSSNESAGKVRKSSPSSQKSDNNGAKKQSGSEVKSPAKADPGAGKASPPPAKPSGSPKASSGSGKAKAGGKN